MAEDELAREKQEVERLRGLLIARDRELGEALGRLAELEARSGRLTGLAKKLLGGLRRS
jgi:hypothetical protein